MRDFMVIVLVFALVVAGYYGYKQFFGEKVEMPEAHADPAPAPAKAAPAPAPVAQKAQEKPGQVVDPLAAARKGVITGQSDDMAADLFYLARHAASEGESEKSTGYMQRIYNEYPDSPYAHHAAAALAEHKLSRGDMWEARNLLSFAYDRTSNAQTRKTYTEKMDKLNAELVFGPARSKDSVIYQVQPGDYLSKLAARFNCPYRLIMKINNISDPRKLRVGQRLKILVGPDGGPMQMSILVDKSEFRLTVYLNGHYLREYRVGIGRYDFTPSGEFTVGERLEHPEYLGKPYGHPENILGDYWITLENSRYPGLGIHGTKNPESIGKKDSQGCIRMHNKDVGEVFRTIPKGAKVTIRE